MNHPTTQPTATKTDWRTLLIRTTIPISVTPPYSGIIMFAVGNGSYHNNKEGIIAVWCRFNPDNHNIFQLIEFADIPLVGKMPKLQTDVRIQEWEHLFHTSGLHTTRKQNKEKNLYWVETPINEYPYRKGHFKNLCVYYDSSNNLVSGISLLGRK